MIRNSFAALAVVALTGSVALACQVPVFRYALERWPADHYEMVVIHSGEVSPEAAKKIDALRKANNRATKPTNYSVRVIEASKLKEAELRRAWSLHKQKDVPLFVALFPRSAQEVPQRLIDAMPLKDLSVDSLAQSPVRQTIAKRIVAGQSAVWIFVPSGDDAKDKLAYQSLQHEVEQNEKNLELPEQDELENVEELLEQVDIELRLDFSIVTLDRNDKQEQFLLKMLLASEVDLAELNEPMAFPVLGRGRVLYALVGKGINELTIGEASRFIIGPCSCQVKSQNPGFDLLMSGDWDASIGKTKLSEPLPEETGKPIYLAIPPG